MTTSVTDEMREVARSKDRDKAARLADDAWERGEDGWAKAFSLRASGHIS